jgi:outer membrane protein assembly factor BamE (lipoprotein component of BamABCDE complex)
VGVFLKKGVTTQSQVIEKLGTPNIITTDSEGREMWTYQQHSISGSSADISIEGAGVADNKSAFFNHGALSAWLGGSTYTESSKTATLVVKFNRHQVVDEYQSFYSSF